MENLCVDSILRILTTLHHKYFTAYMVMKLHVVDVSTELRVVHHRQR